MCSLGGQEYVLDGAITSIPIHQYIRTFAHKEKILYRAIYKSMTT